MTFTSDKSDIEKIEDRIHALEMRMESFEARLKTEKAHVAGLHQSPAAAFNEQGSESEFLEVDEAAIESRIGEYGLAWLGSLVLLFGIIFLMAFASNQGFPVLASALGYASAAGVFILAHFLRKSFPHMVFMLNISSHILIYYITLRLFFFSASPIIPSRGLDLALLMAAIGVQFYLAKRQLSELLTGIALVLIIVTAMIADSFHITMSLITVAAAVSLYFLYRYNWWRLVIVSLILVYVAQVYVVIQQPAPWPPR